MQVVETRLPGVVLVSPLVHRDDRGLFCELFNATAFEKGVPGVSFVQDNMSMSDRLGTIRGLHFQTAPFAQGKLVRCMRGAILDVALDIRAGSPTFGRHVAVELTADCGDWLWIPAGFAHGFCTLTPRAEVLYKVTAPYSRPHERGIAWDDPALGIVWPVARDRAVLSEKDKGLPRLAELSPGDFGATGASVAA